MQRNLLLRIIMRFVTHRRNKTIKLFVVFVLMFAVLNLWVTHYISRYEAEHVAQTFHTFPSTIKLPTARGDKGNPTRQRQHDRLVVEEKSSNAVSTIKSSSEEQAKNTGVCHGYKGVLHIKMGDIGGAAGTIFFQFVLAQLIYAEQYRLIPWIYFDNVSDVIYDPIVHGSGPGIDVTFRGVGHAVDIVRPNGHWRDVIPGAVRFFNTSFSHTRHFDGNGVWNNYFLPVSPSFLPGDISCQALPYVTLTLKQITPGLHGFVSWAPKCWRYHYLPDYITRPHIPIREWLRPFRLLGHKAVEWYGIKFQPQIVRAARNANPFCAPPSTAKCLGLHIRHSDKAAGRRQVPVSEFLPYVRAFVHAGGDHIYLATDSTKVLQEIAETWPGQLRTRIKSLGDDDNSSASVIRSDNDQAVFDMASHHRTNSEVLVEILALSWCRFMVHGLSAVSESSLWLSGELLQAGSIDLEDPNRLDFAMFGTLVQMELRDDVTNPNKLPRPPPSTTWWKIRSVGESKLMTTSDACSQFQGVIHIASTGGDQIMIGMAFFTNILNQIIYAERHNWMPWIHLQPSDTSRSVLYDRWAHGQPETRVIQYMSGFSIQNEKEYPDGPPKQETDSLSQVSETLAGNGIWDSYMKPIVRFHPQDKSCTRLPMVKMTDRDVMSLTNNGPWAVRAWNYDAVPDSLSKPTEMSWRDWYAPIRQRAHDLIQKYYRFQPYLMDRADAVNPVPPEGQICLSVHMRNGDKKGKWRRRVSAKEYLPYFQEFVEAGGTYIYVSTDSQRALQYMEKNFPVNVTKLMRTQGDQVVRTNKEWPLHMIDNHHRVNGEALVDTLAMTRCHFLIHTFSTMAEAAIYLNLKLHDNSINLEDPDRMIPSEFGKVVKQMVAEGRQHNDDGKLNAPETRTGPIVQSKLDNATILFRDTGRDCRRNALVYLAQKKHSSYTGKDSYASLVRSLDLVRKNYLSLNNHLDNLDLFIFHTNDFTEHDLEILETHLGSSFRGVIRLVDLSDSPFWQRPSHHASDDPAKDWYAYPLFSEGYRRMMHWFAIDLWDFFFKWNEESGCAYRYIFRLDEDSFIHSPIRYDIFEFMQSNQYVYGYRLCAYEMQVTRRMWTLYGKRTPEFRPERNVNLEMCGFYNNFFVADLEFFTSDPVQKFLRFIDRQGQIYRRRLGDLMIHSMSVYAFAQPGRIHRFLDFTYEHGTIDQSSGCLVWGGIQAGYDDENATATFGEFYQEKLLDRGCPANATLMCPEDLSPTYAHLAKEKNESIALHTITAGRVEFPLGKGILSG